MHRLKQLLEKEFRVSQPKQDDEIDLLRLIEILWKGKWIIVAFICVSLLLSVAFNFYKKRSLPIPHFAVLAPYSVNLFRPLHSQICREHFTFDFVNIRKMEDLDCVRKRMSADFKKLAEGQWSRNRVIEQEWKAAGLNLSASQPDCPEDYFCLMLTTRSPLDPKIYNRQLQNYNEVLTESIIKEVKAELSYQFTQDANSVLSSEAYAGNIIKLRRLLNGIEGGQMAINFGKIEVKKVLPTQKQNTMLALSFLLGGVLGSFLVLLRHLKSKRRNALGQF